MLTPHPINSDRRYVLDVKIYELKQKRTHDNELKIYIIFI